jgi:hypothetical protein
VRRQKGGGAISIYGLFTFGYQKPTFFNDCDADGFSCGIGVPACRENASLNPITLKSIVFSLKSRSRRGDHPAREC